MLTLSQMSATQLACFYKVWRERGTADFNAGFEFSHGYTTIMLELADTNAQTRQEAWETWAEGFRLACTSPNSRLPLWYLREVTDQNGELIGWQYIVKDAADAHYVEQHILPEERQCNPWNQHWLVVELQEHLTQR